MSVDYCTCDCCEEALYEEYVDTCHQCGHSLCTDCLINKDFEDNYAYLYRVKYDGSEEQKEKYCKFKKDYKIGDRINDAGIDPKYCPFCNHTEVHDSDLLIFLLNKQGISKEEAIEEYLMKENRNA